VNFSSLAFFIFLPLVWLTYWLLVKRSWQNLLLLCASYFFYGWWDYRFCVLMLASTLVDYFLANGIHRAENPVHRKRLLIASLACNLGLLGVFKYFNFFLDNLIALGDSLGWNLDTGTLNLILPVGISFYTFQTLSYTIDVYYRRMEPTRNLVDYMTFVSFFPQLVAGPIERAKNLLPQFEQRRFFHLKQMQLGVLRILWGLFKKVVIADTVAGFVNSSYNDVAAASGAELTVATFLFAFQIYCDFSGYSDIAIGTAQMFGIKLMRNFAYPYFSQNLREFWSRWHISLSTWFRDYVYIPLGGNRVSAGRQKLNLLITFLISGFWHGAAWPFIVWGGLHGTVVAFSNNRSRTQKKRGWKHVGGDHLIPSLATLMRMSATFLFVCFCWIFFRGNSMADCVTIIEKISSSLLTAEFYLQMKELLSLSELRQSMALIGLLVGIEWIQRDRDYPLEYSTLPQPLQWSAVTLVAWFVMEYASRVTDNPFIYFQF